MADVTKRLSKYIYNLSFWICVICVAVSSQNSGGFSSNSAGYTEKPNYQRTILTNPACKDAPYNETVFPNLLGHRDQNEAQLAFNEFTPLINTGCSKHLKDFLCFALMPPWTMLGKPIPVCRSLCRSAATPECMAILAQINLKPLILECNSYPNIELCIGENNTISEHGDEGRPATSGPTNVTPKPGGGYWYSEEDQFGSEESDVKLSLYLLATSANKIQLLDIRALGSMDTITVYRRLGSSSDTAIDYYMPDSYIYWASHMDGKIFRGKLVMDSLRDVRPVVDTGSANVESLAVDWSLRVLFWTESLPTARIRTSSLSGRGVATVISSDIHHPISITLDPTEGKIFWINRRNVLRNYTSNIECYSIVTEKRQTVFNVTSVTIPDGGRPKALVADIVDKRVYWADARSQSLHSIRYDGTDLKTLLWNHARLHEPESIAIYGDHVIWTDKMTSSLIWVNKNTGDDELIIKSFDSYPPQNLRIFGNKRQNTSISYRKSSLAKKWLDLSSTENMKPPPIYDNDYDNGEEDYSDYNDKNEDCPDEKTGSGENKLYAVEVFYLVIFNLFIRYSLL